MTEYKRSPLLWSGSKFDLLDDILPRIKGRLWEPFAGSAVVSLNYEGESVISDRNAQLMNFWHHVKEDNLLPMDENTFVSEAEYYACRKAFNASLADRTAEQAIRFWYLNRLCWRGLYRENQNGEFNTPWGARKKVEWPSLPDVSRIELGGCQSYDTADCDADTIYCDPPYAGTHDYGVKFDHDRLARWCIARPERVLVSNSPEAVALFPGWEVTEMTAKGGIGHGRKEVLLWNGK